MKKKVLTMAAIGAVILTAAGISFDQTALAEANHGAADRYAVARLNTVKENHLASLRAEALQSKDFAAALGVKDAGPASSWLKKVSADEVNMVTNRHEKKRQGEVNLGNKSYYCSGEAYVQTMAANPSLRFAKDPLTNKRVDKSEAVIYADASGAVYYFESEDTCRGFLSLNDAEKM